MKEDNILNGTHSLKGDWEIPGYENLKVPVQNFIPPTFARLKVIKFNEICCKNFPEPRGKRYALADPRFPGIVAEGVSNPEGKRYRLCDGRHRVLKMKLNKIEEAVFFVIDAAEFKIALDEGLRMEHGKSAVLKKVSG